MVEFRGLRRTRTWPPDQELHALSLSHCLTEINPLSLSVTATFTCHMSRCHSLGATFRIYNNIGIHLETLCPSTLLTFCSKELIPPILKNNPLLQGNIGSAEFTMNDGAQLNLNSRICSDILTFRLVQECPWESTRVVLSLARIISLDKALNKMVQCWKIVSLIHKTLITTQRTKHGIAIKFHQYCWDKTERISTLAFFLGISM